MMDICLIGYGAIGRSIMQHLGHPDKLRISHVVVRKDQVAPTQTLLNALPHNCIAVSAVPAVATLVLECAGHSALLEHVVPALERGVECAVLSVGALSTQGMPERLALAATHGGSQVHLLSGAVGGIDALSSAKLAGLSCVTYTARKPPQAWGLSDDELSKKPIETNASGTHIRVLLDATARQAALQFPKNANVAATVALAGLGLDATKVRLLADPSVADNIHEIEATGSFGSMRIEMRGRPLADNPKTSALTVLSALRFLHNRAVAITI
jgi:aspartate dehydrogenase